MSKPTFVQPKYTNAVVRPSEDDKKPITIAFTYEGRGKDQAKEGLELDITREDAVKLGRMLLAGANGEWKPLF